MPKIRFKRGLKTNLPVLDEGEPGFTTDTEEFFIGSQAGNIEFAKQSDLDETNVQVTANTNSLNNLVNTDTNAEVVSARSTYSTLGSRLDNIDSEVSTNTSSLAESTQIKGTTQSIIFNTDGTVQKVQHKDASNNIVREDDFTYSTNLITEVRAVGSSSITFKYHLDTLQTEVI